MKEARGSHGASLRVFKIIQVRSFTMISPSFSPGATAYLLALDSGLLAEATGALRPWCNRCTFSRRTLSAADSGLLSLHWGRESALPVGATRLFGPCFAQ